MRVRFAIAAFAVMGLLPGCSLPRGPINVDPLLPRWLAEGEVSCECPPEGLPYEEGIVDPAALQPPVSKFHPVPTRPVFESVAAPPGTELQL
jgi:hypothetical protein